MSVVLPQAPSQYDQQNEQRTRELIRQELAKVFERGGTVEIGNGRLVLKDTVTGTRYNLTIASGVVTLTSTTI